MSSNYVKLEGKIISLFKNQKTTRILLRTFDLYGNTVPCIVFNDSTIKKYVDQFKKNDEVVLEGYIKVSSYINKDGSRIPSIEVVITSIRKKANDYGTLVIKYDWLNECNREE